MRSTSLHTTHGIAHEPTRQKRLKDDGRDLSMATAPEFAPNIDQLLIT